jgi:cyclopropane fatty-acyl-phospholipid synthase-like methyltransferase
MTRFDIAQNVGATMVVMTVQTAAAIMQNHKGSNPSDAAAQRSAQCDVYWSDFRDLDEEHMSFDKITSIGM